MTFQESVQSVLTNYAKFDGRARRSEYWWFVLFNVIVSIVAGILDQILIAIIGFGFIGIIASLALLIPGLAVAIRRLHDTDRSGWWLLIILVPVLGFLAMIYFTVLEGTKGENRFGPKV